MGLKFISVRDTVDPCGIALEAFVGPDEHKPFVVGLLREVCMIPETLCPEKVGLTQ